jgi:CTP:phosphocholine cytidylyltransferase-like protein
MSKVERGVILAAGFGSRMMPVTLSTPKPLVKVNGVSFIESIIEKMLAVGIQEIYVVRGYLKEKFDVLLEKYPFIKFIDNDLYDSENNISSAMKAIDLFGNAYICEADFIVRGDDVFTEFQEETNYLATPVISTDD